MAINTYPCSCNIWGEAQNKFLVPLRPMTIPEYSTVIFLSIAFLEKNALMINSPLSTQYRYRVDFNSAFEKLQCHILSHVFLWFHDSPVLKYVNRPLPKPNGRPSYSAWCYLVLIGSFTETRHFSLWFTPGEGIVLPTDNPVSRRMRPWCRTSGWQWFYPPVTKLFTKRNCSLCCHVCSISGGLGVGTKRPSEPTESPEFI